MNYIEALQRLVDGKRIRGKNWGKKEYVYLREGNITTDYGEKVNSTIYDAKDILCDSWEIYETEEERLIQNGKRCYLQNFCSKIDCEICERDYEDLYNICHKNEKEINCCSLFKNISDDEINKIYKRMRGR